MRHRHGSRDPIPWMTMWVGGKHGGSIDLMAMSTIEIKKAILHGAGDLRIESEPFALDSLEADQVLVRTIASGFSTGTDLANYLGRSTELPGAPGYPRAVGYSNAGVVWKAGSAVRGFKEGDAVFSIKTHRSAFVTAESELLVPVPAGLDPAPVSLAYLANLGVASLRAVHYQAGERIAVVGLGVIGLCTVALGRAMGASVIAIANDVSRAALARRLGARPDFGGEGADIVVLTANTWEAYRSAVDIARHGGRISVLGFPGRGQGPPQFNPLDPQWFYGKQLTLSAAGFAPRIECGPSDIRFNLRRNLTSIFEWMASGTLDLAPIISHRIPFHRMQEAYELALGHSKELTAAVFDWTSAHEAV
ncbi:MAG TPA: zinc-binding alcohol dehydrogenase [Bryobacteraceae bacterium]|jgi:threonine dehydrogenase-like Zn-dependent dehydrogenase